MQIVLNIYRRKSCLANLRSLYNLFLKHLATFTERRNNAMKEKKLRSFNCLYYRPKYNAGNKL